MATDLVILHGAAEAEEDLSEKQYTFVVLSETGAKIKAAGENTRAFVLLDNPSKGRTGTYAIAGRAKAVAGAEIKAGEPISVDSEGHAVAATATKLKGEGVEKLGTLIVGIAAGKVTAKGQLVPFYVSGGRA